MTTKKNLGDMPAKEFKQNGYSVIDWVEKYFNDLESFPVVPPIKPGDIKKRLPSSPPAAGEKMEEILKDINSKILPGVTHWNHPNFMAYFNSSSSGPGILADIISSAFNSNGMIWKSAPALTELEDVTAGWFRDMVKLPKPFKGIIYDTASVSSMHAIAAARENIKEFNIRQKGLAGSGVPPLRLYASEHAHSSIDKGVLTLGMGLDGIRKIPTDENFRMIPAELEKAIKEDRANGFYPYCVVATIGTTSITSVDPVEAISKICKKEKLWLHVDAAHAGVTALLDEMKEHFVGWEEADSVVINPHKWLFVPIDLSLLYIKNPDILKQAFSLTAEYLKTAEGNITENLMDYGIQLGRRFRSLKLWFVIRYFGVEGLTARLREHIRLGQMFAAFIDDHKNFERLAPTPFSTVCFRVVPDKLKGNEEKLNSFNETLMDRVNATGKVFITHTKLNGKFTIRLVVSGLRTEERHVLDAWELIKKESEKLSGHFE